MANDFDNVRLPENIERGATGGPSFLTTVITMASGKEQRNQEWEVSRGTFDISYGIQGRSDLEEVYSFFHARRGRARAFRFRNWLDFSAVGSIVGTVVGDPLRRQLIRVYDDTENPYLRIVRLPIVSSLKVYINSVMTTDYTLEENGVLLFPADPGIDVKASFEYDIPVRFDADRLNVQLNTYTEGQIPSIQIVEIV